jgi:hypothetical protein
MMVYCQPGDTEWQDAFGHDHDPQPPTSATPALPRSTDRMEVTEVNLAAGSRVFLCTDGMVTTLLSEYRGSDDSQLVEAWREPPTLLDYVQQVGVLIPACRDDRTAVTAWISAGTR